ncbi:MAG: dihydrolipoyl dehydrogenase [Candidatus Aminicenantales bacterium]
MGKASIDRFDLVVVGAGAGLILVEEGLKRGLKVALVESGKIGGTCLTRGCIPSKVLIAPADAVRQAEHARRIGVGLRLEGIDWDLISRRMWKKIDLSCGMESKLAAVDGLTLFRGAGEFTGDRRMRVRLRDGTFSGEFEGERILLAPGTRSAVPPVRGLEETSYVTSESFFGEKFPKQPWKSLILVGGGIIAAEFAHIFSSLGTQVTILEMLPRLLTTEEPEISDFIERQFRKRMDVRLGAKAVAARASKGGKTVVYEDAATGETGEIKAEEVFIAAGRRSNADTLRLEKTGVETDARGWIVVNEFLETSKPGIWALGDATGSYQFRHKANYDTEILVHNMFGEAPPVSPEAPGPAAPAGRKMPVDYSAVPWAVYTDPPIGHVGMTEKEAVEAGHEIYIALNRFSDVAKGYAMGYEPGNDDDGFVKLVIDKSYRILGAHVVGPQADILIQPFVYLMNAGFTCDVPEKGSGAPALLPKAERACPEAGSFLPIYRSMIIHPSLNEVTGWALGNLRPVNIKAGS